MNSYDYIFQIKKLSLFKDLPAEVVTQLIKKASLLKINHNKELKNLLTPDAIFIILKGKIHLLADDNAYEPAEVVAEWSEGDVIPFHHDNEAFLSLFDTNIERETLLLQLPIQLFFQLSNQHPQVHLPLLKLLHVNLTFSYRILHNYSSLLHDDKCVSDIQQQNGR